MQPCWGFVRILSTWHRAGEQAQTLAELHIYVEGACNWNNKSFGLCLPPTRMPCPPCQWSGRCRTPGMPGTLPPGCTFINALSQHLPPKGAALVSHWPRLLASTPQLFCNHSEVHQWMQLDCNQPKTTKRKLFFKPSSVPHSSSLSCTGSDPHVLLLAVMLAYAGKVFMALRPAARDDLEVGGGGGGGGVCHAGPRTSLPPCVGGGRAASTAELINQKQWCWWRYLVYMRL